MIEVAPNICLNRNRQFLLINTDQCAVHQHVLCSIVKFVHFPGEKDYTGRSAEPRLRDAGAPSGLRALQQRQGFCANDGGTYVCLNCFFFINKLYYTLTFGFVKSFELKKLYNLLLGSLM